MKESQKVSIFGDAAPAMKEDLIDKAISFVFWFFMNPRHEKFLRFWKR